MSLKINVCVPIGAGFSAIGQMTPQSGMVLASGTPYAGSTITVWNSGENTVDLWVNSGPILKAYPNDLYIDSERASAYGWNGTGGSEHFGHSGDVPFSADINQYKRFHWYDGVTVQTALFS